MCAWWLAYGSVENIFRKKNIYIWSVRCTKLESKMKENKFLINLLDEN